MSALLVLDTGPGEPSRNMAFDEALLHGGSGPVLRFYGWLPQAVSLGRFQQEAQFADVAMHTPIVRRPTGGGAIHHAHELTYALVVDAGTLPADLADSYALVHDAFVAALAHHGVRCHRKRDGRQAGARPIERWCFAEPGAGDLVDNEGRKLLGSAQRRIRLPRERVLQHGSLVLHPAPHTPFTAAVCHQADPGAILGPLQDAIAQRLARTLGLAARQCSNPMETGIMLP